MNCPKWLEDARFYEIYPQSFYDSNNDGIGDLNGIALKLDYIKSLGCNAIWLNPIFESPFQDAGYDISDYKKVAPRYGTNEDLINLVNEVHKRGMHILLDLVPCHTSVEHPWFKRSCTQERNEYSSRYIWTHSAFERPQNKELPCVGGMADRNGEYVISFFSFQPSLNYGFYKRDEHWQFAIDSKEARSTQNAMIDVMRFWLSKGVDGFRVDMAGSLVKNDVDEQGTMASWKYMLGNIKKEFPNSAFVAEWANPDKALNCGFDMDFYLDHGWGGGNGLHHLLRDNDFNYDLWYTANDRSYFKTESTQNIHRFLDEYIGRFERTKDKGYISFLTNNHDMIRLSYFYTEREVRIIYAFMFTMPGVPFLYYGDEINMRYQELPTKEGGYHRTGSRTPMQWDNTKNKGFSKGDAKDLYLPVDDKENAPTVSDQINDESSMLNYVKTLLKLRIDNEDLSNKNELEIIRAGDDDKLFIYRRGKFYMVCNPSLYSYNLDLKGNFEYILGVGDIDMDKLRVSESSFIILKRK